MASRYLKAEAKPNLDSEDDMVIWAEDVPAGRVMKTDENC
jgi:hypothetical protein